MYNLWVFLHFFYLLLKKAKMDEAEISLEALIEIPSKNDSTASFKNPLNYFLIFAALWGVR